MYMLRPVCETSHFTEWHIFLSFREMDNPIVHFMKWARNEFETCHSVKWGTLILFVPRYGAAKIYMNKAMKKHLKSPLIWAQNHFEIHYIIISAFLTTFFSSNLIV